MFILNSNADLLHKFSIYLILNIFTLHQRKVTHLNWFTTYCSKLNVPAVVNFFLPKRLWRYPRLELNYEFLLLTDNLSASSEFSQRLPGCWPRIITCARVPSGELTACEYVGSRAEADTTCWDRTVLYIIMKNGFYESVDNVW